MDLPCLSSGGVGGGKLDSARALGTDGSCSTSLRGRRPKGRERVKTSK